MAQYSSFPMSAHERLAASQTVASLHRQASYHNDAPTDKLDRTLRAHYDHHREFLKDANETQLQKETLIPKRTPTPPQTEAEKQGHPLRIVTGKGRREDINCAKNYVHGHYNQSTKNGFSRKPDGGFYKA